MNEDEYCSVMNKYSLQNLLGNNDSCLMFCIEDQAINNLT